MPYNLFPATFYCGGSCGLFRWCNGIDAAGNKCLKLTSETWPLGKIAKYVSNQRAKSMAEPNVGILSLCSRYPDSYK